MKRRIKRNDVKPGNNHDLKVLNFLKETVIRQSTIFMIVQQDPTRFNMVLTDP